MAARGTIDTRAASIMVVLCMIWGLQQIALKGAAPNIAPAMQIALRSAGAALLVAALMAARGERLTPGLWKPGLLVGLLFGMEYLLVSEGLRHTTAAHVTVFLYTSPIFAAIGLHIRVPAERLRALQWLGIAMAFAGIATAFLARSAPTTAHTSVTGDLLGLLAGAAWGLTTVSVRGSALTSAPATETLLYQLMGATVLLAAQAFFTGQTHIQWTPTAWASLGFQTLVVSFASFLAWFWLLRHYSASRLGVFSFLTPLFGVGFSVWLLNEPLEPAFVVGAAFVLAGIVLVSAGAGKGRAP